VRRTALLLAAALLLPACGDDEPKSSASREPSLSFTLPTGTPTPSIPATKPTRLLSTDVVVGTGKTAVPGNTLTVKYRGLHYDGKEFDSTFDPGDSTISFILGGEEVIAGWDQGLIGMKEGGRRQLVIPPDLAYGPDGGGPIGPNETLIFIVDLVSVDAGVGPQNTFAPQ
jgi:hypothetical protein